MESPCHHHVITIIWPETVRYHGAGVGTMDKDEYFTAVIFPNYPVGSPTSPMGLRYDSGKAGPAQQQFRSANFLKLRHCITHEKGNHESCKILEEVTPNQPIQREPKGTSLTATQMIYCYCKILQLVFGVFWLGLSCTPSPRTSA